MNPAPESIPTDRQNMPDPKQRALATRALARRGALIPPALSARFADYVDTKIRPYIFAVIVIGALGYFLFVLADFVVVRDVFGVSLLVERLTQALAEPFPHENTEITIGCSVGIAIFPEHGDEAGVLQQVADNAVYEAKAAGRNCARMGLHQCGLASRNE